MLARAITKKGAVRHVQCCELFKSGPGLDAFIGYIGVLLEAQ